MFALERKEAAEKQMACDVCERTVPKGNPMNVLRSSLASTHIINICDKCIGNFPKSFIKRG